MSSICAVEIVAILFLFMMNCYKSSFQECITIIVMKIERQGTSRHIVYFSYKKEEDITPPPVGLSWDSPYPPPESVRTYADVRTTIFRLNGFIPNLLTHGAPRAPLTRQKQVARILTSSSPHVTGEDYSGSDFAFNAYTWIYYSPID